MQYARFPGVDANTVRKKLLAGAMQGNSGTSHRMDMCRRVKCALISNGPGTKEGGGKRKKFALSRIFPGLI
jgi:hypothetical protein